MWDTASVLNKSSKFGVLVKNFPLQRFKWALLGLILALVFNTGLTQTALADEVDDLIEYLIESRQAEQVSSDSRTSLKQALFRHRAGVFDKIPGYELDRTKKQSDAGMRLWSTTYFSRQGGVSFSVKLMRPTALGISQAQLGLLKSLRLVEASFRQNSQNGPLAVGKYPAAYIGAVRGARAKGVILSLGERAYVVVQASKPISTKILRSFAAQLNFRSA